MTMPDSIRSQSTEEPFLVENPLPLIPGSPDAAAPSQTQQFRTQVGQISRQSGIFFLGTVFTAALGYVFKVYLARVLGATALGIYALGITLVGFVGIFNTLGLPFTAMRYAAVYKASGKFRQLHALLWRGAAFLLVANLLFGVVLLLAGRVAAIRFYHSPALSQYLPWFAIMLFPSVLTGFYSKILAGYKEVGRRTLIVSFLGAPMTMGLSVALIAAGFGLGGYLLAQILSAVVVLVILVAVVRQVTPAAARFSAQPWSRLDPEVWSFSSRVLGISMMEFFIFHVDKISLGFYLGAREVGIYSVAAALVAYVPLILHSVNQIFSPTIADLHTRQEFQVLARLFQSLTKWVVALTVPAAVVLLIFARPLMRVFGPDFEAGWPILIIGTVGQLVNCGVGSVGYLLLMSGNERRLVKVQAAMTVVMVALSFTLTPLWGMVGAAIAAALTNVGMNVWNLIEVRKALRILPYNRSYFHLILPTTAAVLIAMVVKRGSAFLGHDWLAIGIATASAYLAFAVIALAFGLDADDRLIARAIWSRLRGAFIPSAFRVES